MRRSSRQNSRHFAAFDSELKFLKLYKYRHFRQGWLPNAASGAFWAHHILLLKLFTALKSLGIFRNWSIGVDKNLIDVKASQYFFCKVAARHFSKAGHDDVEIISLHHLI